MAEAKKCDMCGNYYDPYIHMITDYCSFKDLLTKRDINKKVFVDFTFGIVEDELDETRIHRDFCKECVKKLVLKGIENL